MKYDVPYSYLSGNPLLFEAASDEAIIAAVQAWARRRAILADHGCGGMSMSNLNLEFVYVATWAMIADADCLLCDKIDLGDAVEIMATPSVAVVPMLTEQALKRIMGRVENEAFEGYEDDAELAEMKRGSRWEYDDDNSGQRWLVDSDGDKIALLVIRAIANGNGDAA
jgi:hypothetical protein